MQRSISAAFYSTGERERSRVKATGRALKKCQPKFLLRVIRLKYSETQLKIELNVEMHLEFYER